MPARQDPYNRIRSFIIIGGKFMKTLCSDLKRSRIALILILALFLGSLFQPAVNTQAEATSETLKLLE
jgi:hypothetical protein